MSIIRKKATTTRKVASTRQASRVEELTDTNFGTLDETKDGLVVAYDSTTDKFILVSADTVLTTTTDDGNISDTFITQLESQLDLGAVALGDVDGGSF